MILIRSAGAGASGAVGAGTSTGIGTFIGIGTTIGVGTIIVIGSICENQFCLEQLAGNEKNVTKDNGEGENMTSNVVN